MAEQKLVGQNYTVPDLVAKVTGKSKYAEDFRAEGMIFAKLLLSPLPHARVTRLDVSTALAMPGVKAILTADDLPAPADAINDNGQVILANLDGEVALTNEPVYQGQPILAVAAVDEVTAADAIEKIEIEFEPLPFAVDPLVSLRPGGPNARTKGNYWFIPPPGRPAQARAAASRRIHRGPKSARLKWTPAELAEADAGRLPMMADAPEKWSYGDLEAGFKEAALVLDETFVTPDTSHQTLETRTAMAYWQNGKVHVYTGTQSTAQTVLGVARWVGIDPENVVVVSEYTGGGFGSQITGAISLVIPVLLAKKANAPVMMRISREEEHYIGRAPPGVRGRMKVGFAKDGRITALDMFSVSDNGPFERQGDNNNTGVIASLMYQPKAMRFRGISVLTNTPPRGPQSQPGGTQSHMLMEPVISKAARKLGIDQVAIRKINAPEGKALFGPPAGPKAVRPYTTSAFVKEALDKGAELFRWDERKTQSGKRNGSKVRGVGVAVSTYTAGSVGFDGLISPQTRRPALHPVGDRQSRHRIGQRLPPGVGRNPRRAVGKGRDHLGRHVEESAVDVPERRQPDDSRDDSRRARGGDGREEEAAGDRGERSWRKAGGLRRRQRAGVPQGRRFRHDVGESGRSAPSSSAAPTTVTSCRRTSTSSPRTRQRRSRARV